jgi:hypothetical protein
LGFGVEGLLRIGFGGMGSDLAPHASGLVGIINRLGFRTQGSGFRVGSWAVGRVPDSNFRVWGLDFRIWGLSKSAF